MWGQLAPLEWAGTTILGMAIITTLMLGTRGVTDTITTMATTIGGGTTGGGTTHTTDTTTAGTIPFTTHTITAGVMGGTMGGIMATTTHQTHVLCATNAAGLIILLCLPYATQTQPQPPLMVALGLLVLLKGKRLTQRPVTLALHQPLLHHQAAVILHP